jgi:hypothetical protein
MNPTLWNAYEKLGKFGENVAPNKIFTEARMRTFESQKKATIGTVQKKRK